MTRKGGKKQGEVGDLGEGQKKKAEEGAAREGSTDEGKAHQQQSGRCQGKSRKGGTRWQGTVPRRKGRWTSKERARATHKNDGD